MRMLIDNRDLELLLEKKKKFIGNKVTVDTMIAGISFLFYWNFILCQDRKEYC